jgi:hypothetical protein
MPRPKERYTRQDGKRAYRAMCNEDEERWPDEFGKCKPICDTANGSFRITDGKKMGQCSKPKQGARTRRVKERTPSRPPSPQMSSPQYKTIHKTTRHGATHTRFYEDDSYEMEKQREEKIKKFQSQMRKKRVKDAETRRVHHDGVEKLRKLERKHGEMSESEENAFKKLKAAVNRNQTKMKNERSKYMHNAHKNGIALSESELEDFYHDEDHQLMKQQQKLRDKNWTRHNKNLSKILKRYNRTERMPSSEIGRIETKLGKMKTEYEMTGDWSQEKYDDLLDDLLAAKEAHEMQKEAEAKDKKRYANYSKPFVDAKSNLGYALTESELEQRNDEEMGDDSKKWRKQKDENWTRHNKNLSKVLKRYNRTERMPSSEIGRIETRLGNMKTEYEMTGDWSQDKYDDLLDDLLAAKEAHEMQKEAEAKDKKRYANYSKPFVDAKSNLGYALTESELEQRDDEDRIKRAAFLKPKLIKILRKLGDDTNILDKKAKDSGETDRIEKYNLLRKEYVELVPDLVEQNRVDQERYHYLDFKAKKSTEEEEEYIYLNKKLEGMDQFIFNGPYDDASDAVTPEHEIAENTEYDDEFLNSEESSEDKTGLSKTEIRKLERKRIKKEKVLYEHALRKQNYSNDSIRNKVLMVFEPERVVLKDLRPVEKHEFLMKKYDDGTLTKKEEALLDALDAKVERMNKLIEEEKAGKLPKDERRELDALAHEFSEDIVEESETEEKVPAPKEKPHTSKKSLKKNAAPRQSSSSTNIFE